MVIQALGGCCRRSQQNYENAVKAAAASGTDAVVEHVTDPAAIAATGLLATPGIAIDGRLVSSGRIATVAEILDMIERRKSASASTGEKDGKR
jgi:small redox-active disulfide protein 2